MPVEPFAIPIPVSEANLANFGRLSAHIIAAVNDFNARGDVYDYGPPATEPQSLFRVRVIATALNVRGGPGSTFPPVRTVNNGTLLDVWAVDNATGWYRISRAGQEWITGSSRYTQRV